MNKAVIFSTVSISMLLAACGNDENTTSDPAAISEAVGYEIIGIEPGAGIMASAEESVNHYDNLEGWDLLESSTAGMMTELGERYQNEEPIILTGWTPHFKFAQYDLKFLEDPDMIFGEEENINTITRIGLEEDMPNAFKLLDQFYWEPEDMQQVMLDAQDSSFEEVARLWVEDHGDEVAAWTDGVEPVDGKAIELVLTPWDSERSSAYVLQTILEDLGYEVTLTPVDPSVMFQAIANGDADASAAPWLPITHGSFAEQFEEDFVDLGPNLEGTKLGLVVPEYMEIDSIEELEPAE